LIERLIENHGVTSQDQAQSYENGTANPVAIDEQPTSESAQADYQDNSNIKPKFSPKFSPN